MTERKVDISQEQMADFCRRWQISELALFGSVLREDFGQKAMWTFWSRLHLKLHGVGSIMSG